MTTVTPEATPSADEPQKDPFGRPPVGPNGVLPAWSGAGHLNPGFDFNELVLSGKIHGDTGTPPIATAEIPAPPAEISPPQTRAKKFSNFLRRYGIL